MGISSSTNTINSMIQNTNQIFNTYENICSATQNEVNSVFNVTNCTLSNDKITFNNYQAVSQQCIQNNTVKQSITADVEQAMRQAATAVTQSFSFPSVASANNFIENSVKLGTQIANYYNNKCVGEGLQSNQSFTCSGSTINNSVIEFNSFQTLVQQCMATDTAAQDLTSSLISQLDQSASATQQNTFAYFMLVVVIFIGIIAWAGISISQEPAIQWLIVGLVLVSVVGSVIYTITSKSSGNWPYTKTS
jgi:hypothetical protein